MQQRDGRWKGFSSEDTGKRQELRGNRHSQNGAIISSEKKVLMISSSFRRTWLHVECHSVAVSSWNLSCSQTNPSLACPCCNLLRKDVTGWNNGGFSGYRSTWRPFPSAESCEHVDLALSSERTKKAWKDGLCREPNQVDFPSGRFKGLFRRFLQAMLQLRLFRRQEVSPGNVAASAVTASGGFSRQCYCFGHSGVRGSGCWNE